MKTKQQLFEEMLRESVYYDESNRSMFEDVANLWCRGAGEGLDLELVMKEGFDEEDAGRLLEEFGEFFDNYEYPENDEEISQLVSAFLCT